MLSRAYRQSPERNRPASGTLLAVRSCCTYLHIFAVNQGDSTISFFMLGDKLGKARLG